jgi:hypothetical protein
MTTTTTATSATSFIVEAIPVTTLQRVRSTGYDEFGNPLVVTRQSEPDAPLRG